MLSRFLQQLFTNQSVQVDRPASCDEQDCAGAIEQLVAFEEQVQLDLFGRAPTLDRDVAVHAASQFYYAASFIVYRDISADIVVDAMATPIADASQPSAHYAVDLTFRFLPDLVRLARSASPGDPLVEGLQQWALDWPLSSVGIFNVDADAIPEKSLEPILQDECLRSMYIERILSSRQTERLQHAGIRTTVQNALGACTDLLPDFDAIRAEGLDDGT